MARDGGSAGISGSMRSEYSSDTASEGCSHAGVPPTTSCSSLRLIRAAANARLEPGQPARAVGANDCTAVGDSQLDVHAHLLMLCCRARCEKQKQREMR